MKLKRGIQKTPTQNGREQANDNPSARSTRPSKPFHLKCWSTSHVDSRSEVV